MYRCVFSTNVIWTWCLTQTRKNNKMFELKEFCKLGFICFFHLRIKVGEMWNQ